MWGVCCLSLRRANVTEPVFSGAAEAYFAADRDEAVVLLPLQPEQASQGTS
jgi:hypothetical protein